MSLAGHPTGSYEAVIRRRLDLYHEQTEAVVAKYADRRILTQVDGIGPIHEVTDRIMQSLKQDSPKPDKRGGTGRYVIRSCASLNTPSQP